jgi:hypothetical protein
MYHHINKLSSFGDDLPCPIDDLHMITSRDVDDDDDDDVVSFLFGRTALTERCASPEKTEF